MKKPLTLAVATALAVALLTACGEEENCDSSGQLNAETVAYDARPGGTSGGRGGSSGGSGSRSGGSKSSSSKPGKSKSGKVKVDDDLFEECDD